MNKKNDFPENLFDRDLTEEASRGKIGPIIGRYKEIKQLKNRLQHQRIKNAILVGDPGVGKTAIIEGLAIDLYCGDNIPDELKDARVVVTTMTRLLRGTEKRGGFETHLNNLLANLRGKPRRILFIDEIHTIIGAGQASGQTLDFSNALKPMLERGEISVVGATTFEEYDKYIKNDRALSDRFHCIEVKEPSRGEVVKILNGLKPGREMLYGVEIDVEAVDAMVDLTNSHALEKRQPRKAISVMDEACVTACDEYDRHVTVEVVEQAFKTISSGRTKQSNEIGKSDILDAGFLKSFGEEFNVQFINSQSSAAASQKSISSSMLKFFRGQLQVGSCPGRLSDFYDKLIPALRDKSGEIHNVVAQTWSRELIRFLDSYCSTERIAELIPMLADSSGDANPGQDDLSASGGEGIPGSAYELIKGSTNGYQRATSVIKNITKSGGGIQVVNFRSSEKKVKGHERLYESMIEMVLTTDNILTRIVSVDAGSVVEHARPFMNALGREDNFEFYVSFAPNPPPDCIVTEEETVLGLLDSNNRVASVLHIKKPEALVRYFWDLYQRFKEKPALFFPLKQLGEDLDEATVTNRLEDLTKHLRKLRETP